MFPAKPFTTRGRDFMQVLVLFLLIGMLAACSANSQGSASPTPTSKPSLATMAITAKDFSFDMPETLQAGLVDITMTNVGTDPHQANLARLNQGVTQEQFLAALKKGPEAALPLLTFVGGPNTVDPGQSQEVILNLSPGQYVAICFVSGTDNVPQEAKGMYKFFEVKSSSNPAQVSEPTAQGEVLLKDFSFGLPNHLKAGPVLLKVTNQGSQPHEMTLMKLAPDRSVQDVLAFLEKPAGPPPFADAGGMGALASGMSGWVKLNLTAGDYVALCFVPDPTGKPHFAMGMITSFSVD